MVFRSLPPSAQSLFRATGPTLIQEAEKIGATARRMTAESPNPLDDPFGEWFAVEFPKAVRGYFQGLSAEERQALVGLDPAAPPIGTNRPNVGAWNSGTSLLDPGAHG
jgi:hypothetical protein